MPTYKKTDNTFIEDSIASKSSFQKPKSISEMKRLMNTNFFDPEKFDAEETMGWNNTMTINDRDHYIYNTPVADIQLAVDKDNGTVYFFDGETGQRGGTLGKVDGVITDNKLIKVWNNFIDKGKKCVGERKLGGILNYTPHYFDFFNNKFN